MLISSPCLSDEERSWRISRDRSSLSDRDRHALERLQRAPSAPAGLARRARAVLLMAEDVPGTEVARRRAIRPCRSVAFVGGLPKRGLAGLGGPAAIGSAADRDRAQDGADCGVDA